MSKKLEDFKRLLEDKLKEIEIVKHDKFQSQVVIPLDLPQGLICLDYGMRYRGKMPLFPMAFEGRIEGKKFYISEEYHYRFIITSSPYTGYGYCSTDVFVPNDYRDGKSIFDTIPIPKEDPMGTIIAITRYIPGFFRKEARFVFTVPVTEYKTEIHHFNSLDTLSYDFIGKGNYEYSAGFRLEVNK